MKQPYRTGRDVLAEIDGVLAQKPAQWRNSPLDEVTGILSAARPYAWIGIYLLVNDVAQREAFRGPAPDARVVRAPEHAGQLVVPIRLGIRVLGVLEVAGEQLGPRERVFLKGVATRLARFLSTNGKWLMRKVRESAARQERASIPLQKRAAAADKSVA